MAKPRRGAESKLAPLPRNQIQKATRFVAGPFCIWRLVRLTKNHAAHQQGLQQLGWVDGSNVQIDTHWSTGNDADSKYAAELAALAPDVILAMAARPLRAQKYDEADRALCEAEQTVAETDERSHEAELLRLERERSGWLRQIVAGR